MNALEASAYMRELCRRESDVRMAVAKICARLGYADMYAWAQDDTATPTFAEFADDMLDVYGQFAEFTRRLREDERTNYTPPA